MLNTYNVSSLNNTPFKSGQLISFRLRARNGIGYGAYSAVTIVECDKIPQLMYPPYIQSQESDVDPFWIKLYWNQLLTEPENGFDSVVSYGLEWDQGNLTWVTIKTNIVGTSYVASSFEGQPFASGSIQRFRAYAINGVGEGLRSTVTEIVADLVPQYMNPPFVEFEQDSITPNWILLEWNGILDSVLTGGDPVIYYELQWDQGLFDSLLSEESQELNWKALTTYSPQLKYNFNFTVLDPFPSNSTQRFRLRGHNKVGAGEWSPILTVQTDLVPQYMNSPIIDESDINPTWIFITWTGIEGNDAITGGDSPDYYGLEWDQGTGTWENVTTEAIGLKTYFNFTRSTPFPSGLNLSFRLYAKNGVGYGAYSEPTVILSDSVPLFMYPAQVIDIHPRWISVQWEPILDYETETGRDDPTYYGLEWDQGIDVWANLTNLGMGKVNTFNLTSSVPFPSGMIIKMRTYAKNGVGYGSYSEITTVIADKVPQYMNAPQVDDIVADITPDWIWVTWLPIYGDLLTGGDDVTYYGLEWDQGNGTWTNATKLSQGMVTSFNLTAPQTPFCNGCTIQLRTYAKNGVGFGVYSEVTVVTADSVPLFMSAPQVDYSANHINPSWIYITWPMISGATETGGDDVTYYGLEWDQSNGTWANVTKESQGLVTSFNLTTSKPPFCNGCDIKFRAYAKNGVGYGVYSEVTVITADSVPLFMSEPQVDYSANHINPTWIYITWSPIIGDHETGGDVTVYYGLEWDQANGTWANITKESQGLALSYNLSAPQPPFESACSIKFRAYAKNGVGFGAYSQIHEIQADSIPLFMAKPAVDYFGNMINPKWIYITWGTISGDSETGGDIANHYGIEWDQGNGTWLRLTKGTEGLIQSYNLTSLSAPFLTNMTIKLRAIARNGVGFGAYSDVLTINADSVPLRVNQPVEQQVDYNMIVFSWTPISAWADTGGDDVIYYQVQYNSLSCYTLKDGLPCPTVDPDNWVSLTSENVQKSQTSFTHSHSSHFSRDRLFQYRICAKNGVGMGACSSVTQILTDTIPLKMDAPTIDEVLHDQVHLSWPPVVGYEETGRSPVVLYKVQWDEYQWFYGKDTGALNGTNVTWKDCGTVAHSESATRITFIHQNLPNFIQKRKILYRVQAINNVGEGPYSEPTLTKTRNRYWSKPRSWNSGTVPIEGANVVIPQGQNFTLDLQLSPVYQRIDINGQLEFQEDAPSLNLQAHAIFIKTGNFWIGESKAEPFQGQAILSLHGDQQSQNYTIDSDTVGGNKLLVNYGMFRAYGLKRVRMARLLQSASTGDTKLTLQPGLEWRKGDKIGIAPSDMRYAHKDYAVIESYNNATGETLLDRPLSYYHYGKSTSTEAEYNRIDMRTEVYLLSRNILIQGAPVSDTALPPWGCQLITTQLLEGFSVRKGQTFLDYVELENCSQYRGKQAAIRFDDSQSPESVVSNSALHHGEGVAVWMENSRNVRIVNNTFFDFGKYGFNISSSNNLTIDSNHICSIKDFQIEESPLSEQQPAGIVGCIESDCSTVSITNNVVSGVSYAGYIAPTHECGSQSTQTIFKDNIAHSINGWGAVMFTNMRSFTQQQICAEASYFSAYKCSQGGIIMYNATLTVMFSQMTLIDNQIGGTIMMVGGDQVENSTLLAVFRDSIFYGETEARDCKVQDACYGAAIDKAECFDRNGLYLSYFSAKGKAPLTQRLYNLPLQKIQSDASYGGQSDYRNLTFVNFKSTTTYCGNQQRAIALNPSGADYHPRGKFAQTTFINQHEDAMALMFSPPTDWIDFKLCGIDPCSGPQNALIQFDNTLYSGSLKPTLTPSKFQIAPYNQRVAGKFSGCSYMKYWNAYKCQNKNLGILLFESRDSDNKTRMISPVTVTSREYQTKSQLESFMSHQETIVTQVERLSRFPTLVQTGENPKYDIEYDSSPPRSQRFSLIADNGALTARIHYPKQGAYILRDKSGNQIPPNTWDDVTHDSAPIEGVYCGENRYDMTTNILEFYITPNCTIWIEAVNVIMTNVRMNWTLNGFYKNGGTTTFKNNLASSLDIKPSFIKILQVKQGSVIVDFQIYQAAEDKKFQQSGGLEAVKNKLYTQIEQQTIWLGAPILNATVIGKAAIIVKNVSTFEKPQDWNATGKEVWVNQPAEIEDQDDEDTTQIPLVQTEIKEVQADSSGASQSFAIVIGVILAVLLTFCFIGYIVYRRYKRRSDEKRSSEEFEEKKGNLADYITQSGSSPLKNGDVTSFDEEAQDEQFHPSQMFNAQEDYKSVRKHQESDRLMLQSSERKTRDGFFNENGPQPTFGEQRHPSSEEEEEEAHSDFEKMSDFDIDENDVSAQAQPQNEVLNLEEYEGELGNFEEEFEMPKGPQVVQQFNAKIAPEELIINNDYKDEGLKSESDGSDQIGNLSDPEEEEPSSSRELYQDKTISKQMGEDQQAADLFREEEVKIQGFSEAVGRAEQEVDEEEDFSSIDMGSDEEPEDLEGKENSQEVQAPLENNLVCEDV